MVLGHGRVHYHTLPCLVADHCRCRVQYTGGPLIDFHSLNTNVRLTYNTHRTLHPWLRPLDRSGLPPRDVSNRGKRELVPATPIRLSAFPYRSVKAFTARENASNPTCMLVLPKYPRVFLLTNGSLLARTGSESMDDFRICRRRSDAGRGTVGNQDQGTSFLVWCCRLRLLLNDLLGLVQHLSQARSGDCASRNTFRT